MQTQTMLTQVEQLVLHLLTQVTKETATTLCLPDRNFWQDNDDQVPVYYVHFAHLNAVRKFACAVHLLSLIHALVRGNKDLYYIHVELFQDQRVVDDLVDDFACLWRVPRHELHITASPKGLVAGHVQFYQQDTLVDCTKYTLVGKTIPVLPNQISKLYCNAKFILVLEKDALFARLLQDKFCDKHKCVMITGKGYPDLASRQFLKLLADTYPHIPVYGVADADPYGLEIMHVYKFGSMALSYLDLRVPHLKWLGVSTQDLQALPRETWLPLSAADVKKGHELLALPHFSYTSQVKDMLQLGYKAEVQAMASLSLRHFSETYLPNKLSHS